MRHLLSVVLLLASSHPSSQTSTRRLELGRLQQAPAAQAYDPSQRLALPGDLPERFHVEVQFAGAMQRMELRKHSVRSASAVLRVSGGGAGQVPQELPPVSTYRGRLEGSPSSTVLASLTEEGLRATVFEASGQDWSIEPSPGSRGLHQTRFLDHNHWTVPACGSEAEGLEPQPSPGAPKRIPGQPQPSGRCQTLAEIGFDADFEYYQSKGSSVPNVVAAIDAIMNQVDFFYARDVMITHQISGYVVRTAPFYTPVDGGDLLNQFRDEWNNNQAGIQRDLAQLMTGKPGSLIQYGGLAFVGVVCSGSAYGWNMDGANIVGHEMGHNWGAGHCHDATPCNNMCGACFNVAPITKRIIEAHRDSRACLKPAPFYPTELPPYAYPDALVVHKGRFDAQLESSFDVLENDQDGNCDSLLLASFDKQSQRGGSIRRSKVHAGQPGSPKRDLLLYRLPETPFVGDDSFSYVVRDETGLETTGQVTISVRGQALRAYWRFDDGAGKSITEATSNQFHAQAAQAVSWKTGVYGGAMGFNGFNQTLSSSGTGLPGPWTVTAWFRRQSGGSPGAALIASPNGSLRTQQVPSSGRLGVSHDTLGNFTASQGAPLGTWVHLAYVGTSGSTEVYIDGLLVDTLPVGIQSPIFPASLAGEPLRGDLDELRVYAFDLTPEEVADLHALGGRAILPQPRDGGSLNLTGAALSWTPGLLADSHDVYLGNDYASVRDADQAAPEFMGNQAGSSFQPAAPMAGETTYWRVDERVGASVLRGRVWQYDPVVFNHWPLDELSGGSAFDAQGDRDGSYLGGVLLGQAGASSFLGSSVYFDGSNDRVEIPALNLDTNELTLTAWVRRAGPQSPNAGLVFSRSGSTVAGLNFGNANELRYHWNDSSSTWGWDSGLVVPDDLWVFCALVIEPSQATLYLGQGGILSSAVNAVSHAAEEFDGLLDLGRDRTGGRNFEGYLDDVRIHRAAFSSDEVDALYQASF